MILVGGLHLDRGFSSGPYRCIKRARLLLVLLLAGFRGRACLHFWDAMILAHARVLLQNTQSPSRSSSFNLMTHGITSARLLPR